MKILAAVDIGNSTTEVCLAQEYETGKIRFLSSASVFTTGLKGTTDNIIGIISALEEAVAQAGLVSLSDISQIRLNEAAPVIGGAAMETLTQTVVTESSMLGHNPKTPAGHGTGYGKTINIQHLNTAANTDENDPLIVIVPQETGYQQAAELINQAQHLNIAGAILQQDEAVLVYNRLDKKIPIIDEVRHIHKINEGVETAIEVALPGQGVKMLSNPYGIATLLKLTPDETIHITPIARSLIGAKSAVVMKTATRSEKSIISPKKMGQISIKGDTNIKVDLAHGAEAVTQAIASASRITDITGQEGTNIGDMLAKAVHSMSALTGGLDSKPQIRDLFAVDSFAPVAIAGALAGETSLEKAIAVAAMVTAGKPPMEAIAKGLAAKTGVYTTVCGVEPVMAALGALTTPGAGLPLAVLDLGGGSTDAAILQEIGTVKSVSMAGAGELVTMMIQSQLGLASAITAENIKKFPAAKVESMFHIRLETGEIVFYEEGLDAKFFGAVVVLAPGGMIKIDEELPIEKIVSVRQESKRSVFVKNAMRAVNVVSSAEHGHTSLKHIILVGGSAEDFEIPAILSAAFAEMGIACGRGNVRSTEGPRNAVATGLIMGYAGEK